MKGNFRLSTSNKIYAGIIVLLGLVWFVMFSGKSAYQTGQLFGWLLSMLLLPAAFAWLVWRISGRKEKGGSVTFNVVLSFLLLGQVVSHGSNLIQAGEMVRMLEEQDAVRTKMAESDDPEEAAAAYDDWMNSSAKSLDRFVATATGEEKQFFEIMREFSRDLNEIGRRWLQSYNGFEAEGILDYSLLDSDKEFERQINTVEKYIRTTEEYWGFFNSMVSDLEQRLNVLGPENEYAIGAMEAIKQKYRARKPLMTKLVEAHKRHGSGLIRLLEFLREHRSQWTYEDGQLHFESPELGQEFNGLIDAFNENVDSVNEYSEQFYRNAPAEETVMP